MMMASWGDSAPRDEVQNDQVAVPVEKHQETTNASSYLYTDRAGEELNPYMSCGYGRKKRFPVLLHAVLECANNGHIVSWMPHGRAFVVHNKEALVQLVLPRWGFQCSKFTSFLRQLNLHNFQRLSQGRDIGGYYHEYFLRGKPDLCRCIPSIRVKGTGPRKSAKDVQDPNLYKYAFMPHAVRVTLDESPIGHGVYPQTQQELTLPRPHLAPAASVGTTPALMPIPLPDPIPMPFLVHNAMAAYNYMPFTFTTTTYGSYCGTAAGNFQERMPQDQHMSNGTFAKVDEEQLPEFDCSNLITMMDARDLIYLVDSNPNHGDTETEHPVVLAGTTQKQSSITGVSNLVQDQNQCGKMVAAVSHAKAGKQSFDQHNLAGTKAGALATNDRFQPESIEKQQFRGLSPVGPVVAQGNDRGDNSHDLSLRAMASFVVADQYFPSPPTPRLINPEKPPAKNLSSTDAVAILTKPVAVTSSNSNQSLHDAKMMHAMLSWAFGNEGVYDDDDEEEEEEEDASASIATADCMGCGYAHNSYESVHESLDPIQVFVAGLEDEEQYFDLNYDYC